MPRLPRQAPGGIVYHVLNRGVGRMTLFEKPADYDAFEKVIAHTLESRPMRILGYCTMPNHWHLVLHPEHDGDLAAFMQKLTITHVRRWLEHRHAVGSGHVYQGRYKSFPVEADEHLFALLRYVERNPLRAGLVKQAQDWRWSSLRSRLPKPPAAAFPLLSPLPIDLPRDWARRVNQPESQKELDALRQSVTRSRPLGSEDWTRQTLKQLGLPATLRERGRPRKDVI